MAAPDFSRNGARLDDTRIFYYLDEEDQPYVAYCKVPIQHVTLADVKKSINRPHANYKFFFKNSDPVIGSFKDEINDDGAIVPYCSKALRIVVYLESLDGSVRSEPNSIGSGSTKGETFKADFFQYFQNQIVSLRYLKEIVMTN